MHKTSFPNVDLQYSLALVAWQHGFDGEAFAAMNPIGLGQSTFPCNVTTFKEISICIACECLSLYLRCALNVGGNKDPNLDDFETINSDETGIIVWDAKTVFEKRGTRTWEGKQDVR